MRDRAILHRREHHAAAAVVRDPAADHAAPRRRIDNGQKGIAAGILVRRQQPAGAEGFDLGQGGSGIHRGGNRADFVVNLRLAGAIVQGCR